MRKPLYYSYFFDIVSDWEILQGLTVVWGQTSLWQKAMAFGPCCAGYRPQSGWRWTIKGVTKVERGQRGQRTVKAEKRLQGSPEPKLKSLSPHKPCAMDITHTRREEGRVSGTGGAGDVALSGSGSPALYPPHFLLLLHTTTLRIRSRISALQLYKHKEKAKATFNLH